MFRTSVYSKPWNTILIWRSRLRVIRLLELFNGTLEDQVEPLLSRSLVGNHDCVSNALCHEGFHLRRQVGSNLFGGHRTLRFVAGHHAQLIDLGHNLLDFGMGELDRFEHGRFGQLIRSGLHHHDRVGSPGDDQIQFAALQRFEVRIYDELTVDPPDLDTGNGTEKGMLETASAAEAAVIPMTSEEPVLSDDSTAAMTCVSK